MAQILLHTVTQTAFPVSPGGVRLTAVTVTGPHSIPPLLLDMEEAPGSGMETNFDFGPIPKLVVSSFQINYTVEDCGSGMTLLEGVQSDSSAVLVERTQAGTPGVSGTFDLSFNGRKIRGIPSDVPASTLDQLLEANFPEEGGRH